VLETRDDVLETYVGVTTCSKPTWAWRRARNPRGAWRRAKDSTRVWIAARA